MPRLNRSIENSTYLNGNLCSPKSNRSTALPLYFLRCAVPVCWCANRLVLSTTNNLNQNTGTNYTARTHFAAPSKQRPALQN